MQVTWAVIELDLSADEIKWVSLCFHDFSNPFQIVTNKHDNKY